MRRRLEEERRHRNLGVRSLVLAALAVGAVALLTCAAAFAAGPGSTLWTARYDDVSGGVDSAVAVATSQAAVFVTGSTWNAASGDYDITTLAYTHSGQRLWRKVFPCSDTFAIGVVAARDGSRAFVTGDACSRVQLLAYDAASGALLWSRGWDDSWPRTGVRAIAVSPDGRRVFLAGHTSSVEGHETTPDFVTLAFDAATGRQLWESRYSGPGRGAESATAIYAAPDGSRVYVTGPSPGKGLDDWATIAYDAATGHRVWLQRDNGPGNAGDAPVDLQVDRSGSRVAVTGSSTGTGGVLHLTTILYAATTGKEVWVRRPGAAGDANGASVRFSSDGSRLFVGATSTGESSGADFLTIAYKAGTGTKLWQRRYAASGGTQTATALRVSPDGTLVAVTGTSNDDYATIAYRTASGEKLWSRRFDSTAHGVDTAAGLAFSADSTKLFVTGTAADDYTTIAYRAR